MTKNYNKNSKKLFDYNKVKEKYDDSLSQYDFDGIFENPRHGDLNFKDIKKDFLNFYNLIYTLEVYDYRNELHNTAIQQVNEIRKLYNSLLKRIQDFSITQNDPTYQKNQIARDMEDCFNNYFSDLSSYLNFISFKEPDIQSIEDKELEIEQKIKSTEKHNKTAIGHLEKAEEYLEKIKKEYQNTEFERNRIKEEIINEENKLGTKNEYIFFEEQAKHHKNQADIWRKRRTFAQIIIYFIITATTMAFLASFLIVLTPDGFFGLVISLDQWGDFWNFRAGIFIFSLLSIASANLIFITKNYNKEINSSYDNKNNANIIKSVGLFSSGLPEELRGSILETASRTIFAPYDSKGTKEGSTHIELILDGIKNLGKKVN